MGTTGDPIAANVPTGGPADLDADFGVLAVVDHGGGQSHLTLFNYNGLGELTAAGVPIAIGAADANGVALLAPRADERY